MDVTFPPRDGVKKRKINSKTLQDKAAPFYYGDTLPSIHHHHHHMCPTAPANTESINK